MNFLSDQIGLIISTSIVSTLAAIGLIYFFNFNQNKAEKSKKIEEKIVQVKKTECPFSSDIKPVQNLSQVKIEEQKKHDIQIEKIFKALSQNQKLEPSCDEEEEEEEIMDETLEEEELSQCPFSKGEKKLFANNNEKISPVILTDVEKQEEEEHKKKQLEKIFELLREQEKQLKLNHNEDDDLIYEKVPKFGVKNDDDGLKFSLLDQDLEEYKPLEEKELEHEIESIFSNQMRLYGF